MTKQEIQENKLYSIKFTANILGVSAQTLRNWDYANTFKPIRTEGNHRRYLGKDILERLKVEIPNV